MIGTKLSEIFHQILHMRQKCRYI